MRKLATLLLAIMFLLPQVEARADDHRRQDNYVTNVFFQSQRNQLFEADQAPSAGNGQSNNWIVGIIPEFHYSSHGNLKSKLSGNTDLKSSGGHATAADIIFSVAKPINDTLRLGMFYILTSADYSGGLFTADVAGHSGSSDIDVTSNVVGFNADFDFKKYGRFAVSLSSGFDIYSGYENYTIDGHSIGNRSVDDFQTKVSSIITYYEFDAPLNKTWTISPYVHWRSIYVDVKNANMFSIPAGEAGSKADSNSWTHLLSGGAKIKYQNGPLGFYARGGFNRRVSGDDAPGFGTRAVAPSVIHTGFMLGMDRTLGAWGLGINYVVPEKCVLDFSYNGLAGSEAAAHSVSMAVVFPF
jgi:hypothetical protein